MSVDRWMDEEAVVHIQWNYSAIKRKEVESVLGRWTNLEPLIQSEVSQKEKNKHRINTYIWNPEKGS